MVGGVEDFDDAERHKRKDADGAEGFGDVGGVAGVNDAGRDDSVLTGTGKDRVFPTPMYLNRGCCGCRRGCRSSPLSL